MSQFAFPQLFTILAFGASISLWFCLPTVRLMPTMNGVPIGFIHPYLTAELLLTLATLTMWAMTALIFLDNLRSEGLALAEKVTFGNLLIFCLFVATMLVTAAGLVFYSTPFRLEEHAGDLGFSPRNPYAVVNHLGIIACEVLWISEGIIGIFQRFSRERYIG